ncbi:MAG: TonB-dependent receptor [Rhodospirillaceae bacterium]
MSSIQIVRSAAIIGLACSLAAEEASAQIEEILVTARKREESLQEIPLSITAFDANALERNRIQNIDDLAKYTPGLVFDGGFVPQDTRPQIRGLPATRGRPPVGILIDGIDVSSESMLTAGGGMLANLRLLDTERIEVVKGPQSALYGRVAFGGAINYVSKKPGDDVEGNFSADAGNYGQFELRGAVSGPVSDKVSLGVNVAYAEHNGYYDNSLDGQDLGGFESAGFSVAARFVPNDNLVNNVRISYSEDEYAPRAQTLLSRSTNSSVQIPLPASAVGLLIPGTFGPTPLGATVFVPRPGELTSPGPIFLSQDAITGDQFKGSTLDSLIISNVLEYDFGDNINLTSWTGYTQAGATQNQDVDFFGAAPGFSFLPAPGGIAEPLPFLFQFDLDTRTKQFQQELRIGDLTSDGLRWSIGGQYWQERIDQLNNNLISLMFSFPGIFPSAALNSSLISFPSASPEFRNTDHWSVYGIIEYDLSDKLSASIEARYSDEKLDVGYVAGGRGANGFVAPIPFLNGPVQVSVGPTAILDSSDNFFTPRFALEYQATSENLLYASVSKGVKPGGVSTIAGTAPGNGRFFPETLWNYEVGSKNSFSNGRVVINGAAFYMDYSGKQVTLLEPNPNNAQGNDLVVRNAGKARVYGLEFELAANPTDEINLSAGYTYLDSKYTEFVVTTTSALGIALAGNCSPIALPNGLGSCSTDFSGEALERSPKHALTLAASYRTPVMDDMDFVIDISGQYQSKRNQDSNAFHFFGSYFNLDGRIGFDTAEWSIFLYGENILDDDTVRSGQGSGDFSALGNLAIILFEPDKAQGGIRFGYRF